MSYPSSSKRGGGGGRVDEDLLVKLEAAGFEIDHAICFDKNPTLQVIYQRYVVANNIMTEVEKMVNARKWPRELGKAPNQSEIIGLFVAKTTWYKSYVKVLDRLDDDIKDHKDMRAWLRDDPDRKPDLELWEGVDVGRSQHMLGDLDKWLDLHGKKKKKSAAAKPAAVKKKGVEKEKAKVASGSGSGKGKEKAKESVGGKKSHKKVTKG